MQFLLEAEPEGVPHPCRVFRDRVGFLTLLLNCAEWKRADSTPWKSGASAPRKAAKMKKGLYSVPP
jgi:hypothetical protein